MNLLVIYTYPNHRSLNYDFLQKVLEGSRENPAISAVQVLDLYEEEFDPVLVFHEQKRRRDMHADPALEKYRAQIQWADKIVFVYPIWWGRPRLCCWGISIKCLPPALLTGITASCFRRAC